MKTYIPKQPKQVRERVEAKLDARLVDRLEKYCQYLESDRDYVLAQALELIFRKDKGFANWLTSQSSSSLPLGMDGVSKQAGPSDGASIPATESKDATGSMSTIVRRQERA